MTDDLTQADLDWWFEKAETLEWTEAKTYRDTAPHEYVVLGRTEGITKEEFVRAGRVIRVLGQPGKFWSYTNLYLTTPDGRYKFWTMDPEVKDTDLINRATTDKVYGAQDAPSTKTDDFTLYDSLAWRYDSIWENPTDKEENDAVRRIITEHFGWNAPSVLDVGCGTGLLLDMGITSPRLFTGIDPSQGMLNELVRKHPTVAKVIPAKAEDVLFDLHDRFDLVTGLFAAPSYMTPPVLQRMVEMSKSMCILMTYEPGYLPDYYEEHGLEEPPTNKASHAEVERLSTLPGGRRIKIGKFDVTVVTR